MEVWCVLFILCLLLTLNIGHWPVYVVVLSLVIASHFFLSPLQSRSSASEVATVSNEMLNIGAFHFFAPKADELRCILPFSLLVQVSHSLRQ